MGTATLTSALGLLGLLLLLGAALSDIRRSKIPNLLVLASILFGLCYNYSSMGPMGIPRAMGGVFVGFFGLLPLYLLRGMAAGDVKLMAAVGTFLGSTMALQAVLATLVVGSVLGIAYVLASGHSHAFVSRYIFMAKTTAMTGKLIYIPAGESDPGKKRFPYATAIFTGTLVTLWLNDMLPIGISL